MSSAVSWFLLYLFASVIISYFAVYVNYYLFFSSPTQILRADEIDRHPSVILKHKLKSNMCCILLIRRDLALVLLGDCLCH